MLAVQFNGVVGAQIPRLALLRWALRTSWLGSRAQLERMDPNMTQVYCHGRVSFAVMQFDLVTTQVMTLVGRQRRRQSWPDSVSLVGTAAASSSVVNKLPLSILLSSVVCVRVFEHCGTSQRDPTSCGAEPGTDVFALPTSLVVVQLHHQNTGCCGTGDATTCTT